jgi:hypothetical protein
LLFVVVVILALDGVVGFRFPRADVPGTSSDRFRARADVTGKSSDRFRRRGGIADGAEV